MSITSIGKYLTSRERQQLPVPSHVSAEPFRALCNGIIKCINHSVLTGDGCEGPRSELSRLTLGLTIEAKEEETAQVLDLISRVLSNHQSAARQTALDQAVEVQHIFAMLNQALIVLAEGSDRSVSRLSRIQELLQRTSQIKDIVALKASLSDTVKFVEAESIQTRDTASEHLAQFQTEVGKARVFLGNSKVEMAGRPEGITRISEGLRSLPAGQAMYAVAYVFDRLQAVKLRYGPEIADEMIFRIIKERVQPVSPANSSYRWTSSSIVGIFERPREMDALRLEVANLNRTPLVHKVTLGNRTAVLTISPSHLVTEGISNPENFAKQVDDFTKYRA